MKARFLKKIIAHTAQERERATKNREVCLSRKSQVNQESYLQIGWKEVLKKLTKLN